MRPLLTLLTLLLGLAWPFSNAKLWGQAPAAYRLLDAQNRPTTWDKMVRAAAGADVVLFGELHNHPVAHWLQLELARALTAHNRKVVMGFEQFETDQQEFLDALMAGSLALDSLPRRTRVWPNYPTDYKHLLAYALQQGIPLVATNCPRPYASRTFREGPEALLALPDTSRALLAPLPLEVDYSLSQYREMMAMMSSHGHEPDTTAAKRFAAAQALKDATMAHRIVQNLPTRGTFIHYNGSFHSDYFQGILWYLKRARPGLRVITLSFVEGPNATAPADETRNRADFILVAPDTFPHSY
jgi:uncharacterized iron-regulated protein